MTKLYHINNYLSIVIFIVYIFICFCCIIIFCVYNLVKIRKGIYLKQNRFAVDDIEEYFDDLEKYRFHDCLYKISDSEYDFIISNIISKKHYKKNDSYKDAIRAVLGKRLGLTLLDTVLFTENTIYIKIFLRVEAQTEKEKRACGIDPEILKAEEEKYFKDDSYRPKAIELLKFAVDDQLSFKKINPYEFKKIFIPVFINIMEIVVIEETEIDDILFLKGFSLFLLRKVFDDFLLYIAEDILFSFSNNEKKAIDFLSCFSVYESVDTKGVKHKANPILDESNHAWNLTTIRSTMLQYKHAKQEIYDIKRDLVVIRRKLQEHELELKELKGLRDREGKRLLELEKRIYNTEQKIESVRKSTSKKLKYKKDDVEEIYDKKTLINILYKKEDQLLQEQKDIEKAVKDIEIKILNKQKDIDIWTKKYSESEKRLKQIEKKGHPIDDQYQRLKFALAKTLAKR